MAFFAYGVELEANGNRIRANAAARLQWKKAEDFARNATRRKAGVPLRSHESEELLARQARLR
jgi:hypothetical protein